MEYLLIFFRIVIGIVFFVSALGKLRNFSEFTQTIQRFQILPRMLISPSTWLFISCEITVVILLVLGKQFLVFGFVLAGLLLLIFSMALLSVLIRKISTPCNCFGAGKNPVSVYDIVRNIIFILCALGGWSLYMGSSANYGTPNLLDWILIGFAASAFVMAIVNLGEIVKVFKPI